MHHLYSIRSAYRHDLTKLVQLFERYRIFYGMPPDAERAETFLLARFKADESKIFIAEDTEKNLIGFTQLYPLFSSTRLQRLWLLNDLYVDEGWRGKGIAGGLIEKAKELVRETKACGLILETGKANATANTLYVAHEFTLDLHHNYYYWNA